MLCINYIYASHRHVALMFPNRTSLLTMHVTGETTDCRSYLQIINDVRTVASVLSVPYSSLCAIFSRLCERQQSNKICMCVCMWVHCCVPSLLRLFTHFSTCLPAMAAERVTSVIFSYQGWLNSTPIVPATTYGSSTLGANGFKCKLFFAFHFSDTDVGVQFLKHVGLLESSILCWKFGSQMYWCFDNNRNDGFRWQCRRITTASACSAFTSTRHGLWFQ
jgi:hypothetical protein